MSKKSAAVSSSLVSALAMSLMACGADQPAANQQQTQGENVRCVQTNSAGQEVVVDDSVCQPRSDGTSAGHWYYGGVGGYVLGSILSGGRTGPAPAGGRSTTQETAGSGGSVSRGGAGSTAGSSSSSSSGSKAGSVGG